MVFDHPEFDNHQQVAFVRDERSGLTAIVAIHYLRGPSAGGGVRFRPYPTIDAALTDVLRLSRAMTYKMVLAGLPMGGAKSVIIGDPTTEKTEAALTAFGRYVDSLGGRYTAGPDVGTNADDMEILSRVTDHVAGRASGGGSTAPPTAVGVFNGIRATAAAAFGGETLDGKRVAVQGAGGVGSHLVGLLTDAGATVLVADVDQDAAESVARRYGATVVAADGILAADVDILSPNAVGGILNADTIPTIKASAICGGANNQLAHSDDGTTLAERDILWAPDYVVSAGGALAGSFEIGHITEAQYEVRSRRHLLHHPRCAHRGDHRPAADRCGGPGPGSRPPRRGGVRRRRRRLIGPAPGGVDRWAQLPVSGIGGPSS